MTSRIILVVDDEETMQQLIKRNLQKLDISLIIYSATSGEEGVKKYKELFDKGTKPDMVIMDLNLTQWGSGTIDGVETTRQIIQIDNKAVIYGYTAWFATAWAKKLKDVGAKDVIERTKLPSEFREIIKNIIENKSEGPVA